MDSKYVKRLLCAALATVAVLGAVACSTTPPRTAEQRQADKETAARVASALSADRDMFTRHIDVRAYNGVVHLSGYVWNDRDMYGAEQVASMVPGVTQVVNEMELERGGSTNSSASR